MDKKPCKLEDVEVRKGPWTMEEDLILMNYIANHGEGVWNTLARSAGLKRTGKSCRLRWLNYLRPDVKRGNITPEEHLLIMELHAKWGNRWSKIAKYLPGRTDNEIKNFWRTRIQKHMKQSTTGQSSSADHHHHHHHHHHQQQEVNYNNNNNVMNDQGNTGQVSSGCSPADHAVDQLPSPSASFAAGAMEAAFQGPFPVPDSHESIWGMEDLWSMHLLNGD